MVGNQLKHSLYFILDLLCVILDLHKLVKYISDGKYVKCEKWTD